MKTNQKARTTIYVEKEIYKKMKYITVTKDLKINVCIKEALEEYVKKNEKFLPKM